MDLKLLLLLTVIWMEVNADSAKPEKDLYELEFWSRSPAIENRIMNIHRRSDGKTTRANKAKKNVNRSTRIHSLASKKNTDKSNGKPLQDDNKSEEEANSSMEQVSVYSLKASMESLQKDLGPETNLTVEVLGRTYEYNDIVILKMAQMNNTGPNRYFRTNDKYIDEIPEKKIMFIVHGLDTKGISKLPCLIRRKYLLKLLGYYLQHLDKFDIYVIPVANPDGFAVNCGLTRNWNKNMSPQTTCYGVNLDRNFDVAWSGSGSVDPCSSYYPGPSPFSEPETRAIRDIFHRFGHKIAGYINVHAGTYDNSIYKGETVLYPKGFTDAQSDDDKYMDMKGEIDEIMRNASFQRMSVTTDTLHRWYGKVTGTSVDYASTVFGIPFALEFVMQIYTRAEQPSALQAVWKRIIDTVFTFIHKRDTTEAQNK